MISLMLSPTKYLRLKRQSSQSSVMVLASYPVFALSLLCSVGVASITLLSTNLDSVVAQVPPVSSPMPLGETTISQVNVLFVNPSIGDDTTGNGSENAPWRTITQALRVATANTVIKLAPGTYSSETGEVFPLMLKSGVVIQGDTTNQGQGILIQGGGQFLSRSFGGQNVAIVGANQAQLIGVTVTNSYPRGYGVWIESTNTIITANTFIGSTQDGVAVAGQGTPVISKNYFYRNGANGITISGNSQPQVRENIFEQTGFGVNVTQNAAPVLVGNQIKNNRAGVIVQAKARPILRQNLIQNSQEDGLVAIAQSLPDLGNATEAGSNDFRDNQRYDINASAAKQAIVAVGNNIDPRRIAGQVSLKAVATPPHSSTESGSTNDEITFTAPGVSEQTTEPNQGQLSPLNSTQTPLTLPRHNQLPTPVPRKTIPTNAPASTKKTSTLPPVPAQATTQLNYIQLDHSTIEFVAPQTDVNSHSNSDVSNHLGETTIESLAVPNGDVPLGNTQNLRKVPPPQTNYLSSANPGVRYRVIVETVTDREQEIVKFLAPGAFPTIWQSRRVMQVGVFSDRNNADEMQKTLMNNGLKTIVEPLH